VREKIRIGVLGGGLMGLRHARVLAGMPGVRLAGVADRDHAARQRAARVFGVPAAASLDQLLEHDPHAVIVALPDNAHRQATLEALGQGLAVLVEKPLAMNVDDAAAIVDAARGRLLMVGHLLRFDPRYLAARRRVEAGELGDLLHAYARRNSAAGAAIRYNGSTRLPWHVSIHDLDILRWVTGREVVTVHAHGVSRAFASVGQLDTLQALLTLDDGSTAVVESCWALPRHLGSAIDSRLEITGTEGMLEVTGFVQGLMVADRTTVTYPDTTRYAEYDDGAGGGILAAELAHFVRCVERETAPLIAPEEGLAAVRLAAAVERSLELDKEVRVG
jgi:predicted dehydrogenase